MKRPLNDWYVNQEMYDNIQAMQIGLAEQICKMTDVGFTVTDESRCKLAHMTLLLHCLENPILFNKPQFDNLLLIYNKLING